MDWQVRPMARQCAATHTPFELGERVHCLLFASGSKGDLERADVRESALAEFQADGTVVGRWIREIRSDNDEAKEARKMAEQSAEMLFFSLYDKESASEESAAKEQRDTLRHLLALLLERRRILRPLGPRVREGAQTYLHVREKREFSVPLATLDPDSIRAIQTLIGELVQ